MVGYMLCRLGVSGTERGTIFWAWQAWAVRQSSGTLPSPSGSWRQLPLRCQANPPTHQSGSPVQSVQGQRTLCEHDAGVASSEGASHYQQAQASHNRASQEQVYGPMLTSGMCRWTDSSSMGQLSGFSIPGESDQCTMQFDWHIQPHRLKVTGGREAKPLGIGAFGVVSLHCSQSPPLRHGQHDHYCSWTHFQNTLWVLQ